jgi:hypothetical protein
MTTKHTAGPWHIARFEASTVEIRNERGLIVAEVGDSSVEDEADARLIAAAPELLEALDILVANLTNDLECDGHRAEDDVRVKLARAAIAKATRSA